MNRTNIVSIAILVILLVTGSVSAMNGLVYLKIPNGAREAAMGETGVSHSRGGAAGWWNPALFAVGRSDVELQMFNWIADGEGSFGGVTVKTDFGGFGGYYFNMSMEGFEVRDRPGTPQGVFTLHQLAIAGGAGVRIGHGLSAGATYKTYTEDIYGDRLSGYNVIDAGLHFASPPTNSRGGLRGGSWSVGTVVTNIALSDEPEDDLPLTVKSGLSYRKRQDDIGLLIACEGTAKMRDEHNPSFHFGVEVDWIRQFYLRTGFITGFDTHSWTSGFGVSYNRFRADVSVTPYNNSLGTVWRFGVGLRI